MSTEPHSAEYLGELRDFWWNEDFLKLMARRWGLRSGLRVLDVGCGVGHWGRLLLKACDGLQLTGVDREPQWVEQAQQTARRLGLGARYQVGTAEALPFPDDGFDVVTCQTVLIHLKDPLAGLAEMKRVLKPQGLLLAAEPHNLSGALLVGKARHAAPVEELLDVVRLQLLGERGKAALGEGDNSLGPLVPGLLQRVGLREVQAWQSDQADLFLPPYASRREQLNREQLLDWGRREFALWSREDTRRYFLAGGGSAEDFERLWGTAVALQRRSCAAIEAGTEELAGTSPFLLVSGRK